MHHTARQVCAHVTPTGPPQMGPFGCTDDMQPSLPPGYPRAGFVQMFHGGRAHLLPQGGPKILHPHRRSAHHGGHGPLGQGHPVQIPPQLQAARVRQELAQLQIDHQRRQARTIWHRARHTRRPRRARPGLALPAGKDIAAMLRHT